MKKFSYLLMAASLLLLIACPGEVVDPKKTILDRQLKSVLSPEMMKTIKGMGMPIHYGTNPPNIEGTYLADDQTMKKSNFEDDDPPGTKYKNEILTISEQDNDNFTATLKLETDTRSNTYSTVISGKGDNFTLYASTKIFFDDNTGSNAVIIYSGTIKDGELHDLHNGLFITDESYFGLGQIYYEADGVAKKIGGGTSEPIEVTGETVKANYKGEDLVMKFPSNLQISIKASNNKGAPTGEISITEAKEMEMFNLGKHIILDFSKTKSAYTVDVEAVVDKGLNAEEDIDCSLFTTDRQSAVATNGRIYKKVDFKYDKETGKLTLSFQANAPFSATKSEGGKYGYLAIATTPNYNFETESISMKAPYIEQVGGTCWAACVMMFVRSYKNLAPDQDNSLFALVKEIGHPTLDQGWNTNFITFWKHDTGNIVEAIRKKIGGDIKISSSSFRRTKSAATEMVKLLRKKHPVILNHGTHVLYVIGYKKGENAGATSFLVHDPQGGGGDMYKWIVWDAYMKQVNFKEAWVRGDALYIIYADKPMLDKPILQTISIPAADTQNQMCPTGTDLTFTMQAYGKARKVFPKYDQKRLMGIGWGKLGYDAENSSNDTLYSPTKLNVEIKVYNADDKPASMRLDMEVAGGKYREYSSEFTCPAKKFYRVRGSDFKESSGKQLDLSLSELFRVPGDKNLNLNFILKNVSLKGNIEEFDYYGLVVKTQTEQYITVSTAKSVGSIIDIYVSTSSLSDTWLDLNNNGQKDAGETITHDGQYTLGSQTFRIYGPVTVLNCENNQLTAIDASTCNTLVFLQCHSNQLTSINVSGCSGLISLVCQNNQIASLDISGCMALQKFECDNNRLTALNLSGYKELKELSCKNNSLLTSLNVSGCTKLTKLYCEKSKLKTIDASGCSNLSSIYCEDNQLTSLNVSGCTTLSHLSCRNNQLTSLDLSECTALSSISIPNNQLVALDFSSCKNLKFLTCNDNQLTSLNVSGCMALKSISCQNNKIVSLNVNGFTSLETLNCKNNQLTTLNVDGCTALNFLDCKNNYVNALRPEIFDKIRNLSYDIRYEYRWDYDQNKYVVSKDHGKGYWYAHEPQGGCHKPNPCNT